MKIIKEGQRRALKELSDSTFDGKATVCGVCGRKRKDAVEAAKRITPSKALEHFKKRTAIITAQRQDSKSQIKDPKQKFNIQSANRRLRFRSKGGKVTGKGKTFAKSNGKSNAKSLGKSNAESLDEGNAPMLPKLTVSEVIVIDGDGESASGAVPQYRIDDLNQLRKAEQIAVGKICDLDRASGHGLSPLLRAWTVIIKEGKRVRELSSKQKDDQEICCAESQTLQAVVLYKIYCETSATGFLGN